MNHGSRYDPTLLSLFISVGDKSVTLETLFKEQKIPVSENTKIVVHRGVKEPSKTQTNYKSNNKTNPYHEQRTGR